MTKLNINRKSDTVKGYDITHAEIKEGRKIIARLWYPSECPGFSGFGVELTYCNMGTGRRSDMDMTKAVALLRDDLYNYYLNRLHDINAATMTANQINLESLKAV